MYAPISTHIKSPHAPIAGSYMPPGTGCRRVSKVLELWILFTERDLISDSVRNSKSTLSMAEGMGWEMFILPVGRRMEEVVF